MHLTDPELAHRQAYMDSHGGSLDGYVPLPRKTKKKRKNPEMILQMACVKWWRSACVGFCVPEFLLWHTQNGMMHAGGSADRERIGGMMKRMGVRAGVPDLFLAVPRLDIVSGSLSGWCGLFVELKDVKGVLTDEQEVVLPELQRHAYQTAVCRTLEDFRNVVTDYLK